MTFDQIQLPVVRRHTPELMALTIGGTPKLNNMLQRVFNYSLFGEDPSQKDQEIHLATDHVISTVRKWFGSDAEMRNLAKPLTLLEVTNQDPVWHAEGDVLTHTEMVCLSLIDLFRTDETIDPDKYSVLLMAALLHDIGKPFTTKHCDDGRIRAKGHEQYGAKAIMSSNPFKFAGFEVFEIVEISRLVLYHQEPKKYIRNDVPDSWYQRLSAVVDTQLLYYLEVADILGRTCEDKDEQLLYLEMFKIRCLEANCFGKQSDLLLIEGSDSARLYYSKLPSHLKYRCFSEYCEMPQGSTLDNVVSKIRNIGTNSVLTLMCGIPGSGKSTYAKADSDWSFDKTIILSLDDIREEADFVRASPHEVLTEFNTRFNAALSEIRTVYSGITVNLIIDNTNIKTDIRAKWLAKAKAYGLTTRILTTLATPNVCISNIRSRNNRNDISATTVDNYYNDLQLPVLYEADEVRYFVRSIN